MHDIQINPHAAARGSYLELQLDSIIFITEVIGDLFEVTGTLVLQRVMLDKSVAGVFITLYDHGTVLGESDIPADVTTLRDTLMRVDAHIKGFLNAVDVNILELDARKRMGIIDLTVVVDNVTVDLAVRAEAEIQVVGTADDDAVVLIDTQGVRDHFDLALIVQQRDDTEGVDDIGVDLVEVGMLFDAVLDQELTVILALLIERVHILDILDDAFRDAVTALALGLLGEYDGLILEEFPQIIGRAFAQIDEIALEVITEHLIEDQLVAQYDDVLFIIEIRHQSIKALGCREGFLFLFGRVNKMSAEIIGVARALCQEVPHQAALDIKLGFTALLLDDLDVAVHPVLVDVLEFIHQPLGN